ncbi:TPA: ead/Ea22-like family protein [Salmonella enterica subsp. enterica]
MTIDKQALREAAGKVNSGDWSYEEFNRLDLPGGSFVKIDGRDAVYCLNKPVGGIKQSRAVIAFIATFNPKVALALLDELGVKEEQRANWFQMAQKLGEDLDAAEKRNVELESKNGYLRTIAHEQNELAIRASLDSNNATVEMGRLHKRIAELEAKLENADKLQDSAFRHGLQHGFSYGQTNDQAGFEQCMAAYSQKEKSNGC